ncbi:hypothetical protein SPAB_04723 [Salmonella enterica subsp. enterica serovar Paratyphi B str. SPB7]|uniref:Uncharacterized protein n=1 Tax=Salmonella paratyphi B (strain ATCC BAA-1250 / SPB7) TaxID=1016998 RepID=A0A6C6Z8R7_SALPB|nr:hypothetical protein SPAB_04723 [Salmonella enterica subsp. enterica serovar Paratyphi B str. SPB7]
MPNNSRRRNTFSATFVAAFVYISCRSFVCHCWLLSGLLFLV